MEYERGALPENPYPPGSNAHQAYINCLALERIAPGVVVNPSDNLPPLVRARFLGFMILCAPTEQGRENFCRDVTFCSGSNDMMQMALDYCRCFLRACLSSLTLCDIS